MSTLKIANQEGVGISSRVLQPVPKYPDMYLILSFLIVFNNLFRPLLLSLWTLFSTDCTFMG